MEPLTIRIENLKAIRLFEWSPSGVCVLVGPNGSGKTTALRVLEVVRAAVTNGYAFGLRLLGAGPLRNLDASNSTPELTLSSGEVRWRLFIDRTDQPLEQASEGPREVFDRSAGSGMLIFNSWRGERVHFRPRPGELVLGQISDASEGVKRIAQLVDGYRYYAHPDLSVLRLEGSLGTEETSLDERATNLFSVLRNWRDLSEHEHRLDFVYEWMSEMFPGFRRLDFLNWGQRVGVSLAIRPDTEKLLASDLADGFLAALCRLTAIASTSNGIVAIDEPETSLHPELIAKLIEASREWSRIKAAVVVLATHSPVVLDQFKDEPEQVFVMQPGHEKLPVPLTDLKKRDWLKHFSLGDLYSHLEVGAPGK